MVYFQTKNPNLGKFFQVLEMENVDIVYGHLDNITVILVYFMVIWYVFSRFGILHRENLGSML
jgi:hypothetical protein